MHRDHLAAHPLEVGPSILGLVLSTADGRAGRVVEVEAYGGADDPASHAAAGRSARNAVMWERPGHLYVYRSYGIHWCANVVTHGDGVAGAVLIRALEPLRGLDAMRSARWGSAGKGGGGRVRADRDLCRGPGRLCQALGIHGGHDGLDLLDPAAEVRLTSDGAPRPGVGDVLVGPRIGISRAVDRPARYALGASPWVSGPRMARPPRTH